MVHGIITSTFRKFNGVLKYTLDEWPLDILPWVYSLLQQLGLDGSNPATGRRPGLDFPIWGHRPVRRWQRPTL